MSEFLRDPRTDPVVGDVLVRGSQSRRVVAVCVSRNGVTVVRTLAHSKRNPVEYSIAPPLALWVRWANGAEILKRGDDSKDPQ